MTLHISASQIETFELCNRKWWFDKIKKLPSPQRPYFAFGTCLHSCLERWILSTPNGRVPAFGPWAIDVKTVTATDGNDFDELTYADGPFRDQQQGDPTELFPPGFETVTEKDGTSQTLTPNEAAQVKKLVHQAIERGIIVKGSNVRVEHHFELQLIEGVKIVGYLDLLRMHETVEHVYTKNGKKSTTTHPLSYPEVHDHKCAAGDTEVYDLTLGRRTINQVGECLIPSVTSTSAIRAKTALSSYSGEKECVRLYLMSGERLILTEDHRVFTKRGWVEVQDLQLDDKVGTPLSLPAPPEPIEVPDAEVEFLAFMMADGCTAAGDKISPTFTKMEPKVWTEFERVVMALGGSLGKPNKKSRATTRTISANLRPILWKHGQKGCKSINKRLPADFYLLDDRQCALFLAAFISCDGSLNPKRKEIIITLANEGLIRDIRHLLLRLGIRGNVYPQQAPLNGKIFHAWRLQIAGEDAEQLLRILPYMPGKETNRQLILKCFQRQLENKGRGGRRKPLDITGEILWNGIRDIEPIGCLPVYDLSVPGTQAWIGNGIVIHNSFGKGSIRFLAQPGPKSEGGALIPIVAPYSEGDGTSPNSVGHKQQNLTYAWATCKVEGYAGPVLVRHNQFPKFDDGKGVRYVEALVGPERLEKHGQYLQTVAGDMVRVSKIKEWKDTPPPKSLSACTDFGGCQFQDICSHRVNLAVYSERTNRFNQGKGQQPRPNLPLPTTTKTTMANVFDKARQQRAQQAAPEAAPTAAPTRAFKARPAAPGTVKDTINGDAAPEKEAVTNGAPWANPGCPACLGLGMNSRGMPCPICDKTAPKRGVPVSDWYEIDTDGGVTLAVARAERAEEIEAMGAPEQWEHKALATAAAAAKPKAPAQTQPAPATTSKFARKGPVAPVQAAEEPEEEEAEAEEVEEVEEAPAEVATASTFGRGRGRPPGSLNKKTIERNGGDVSKPVKADPNPTTIHTKVGSGPGPGRPRSGITLCLGAVFLEGPVRPRMMAQTLLESLGKQMAEDMGAGSFYELDQYKRQDRLRQAGAAIAADLGRTEIIFPGSMNDFDLVALHTGLAPHAENIIGRLG